MNRVELRINGSLIFGISCDIEKPKNEEETIKILEDILAFYKAPKSDDTELFPNGLKFE